MPLIPGHEGVGLIKQAGRGVTERTGLMEAERVALPWLGSACGCCKACLTGWETLCEKQLNTG